MPTNYDYVQKWLDDIFNNAGIVSLNSCHDKPVKIVFEGEKTKKTNPFEIQSVLSNRKKNAFTVVWADGTHTTVHCQSGDEWDDEKALAMCFTKKALGNKGNFNDKFNDALDNKMKIIPGGAGIVAKHECHCDTPCEGCSCHTEKEETAEVSFNAALNKMGEAAKKTNTAMKELIDELTAEPVKVQRYDLFLMDPCGDKTEIYHQGTDEEIHKAMRAYRMKHYPILEANRTPYRVWQRDGALIVDFGAGSYFKVPGMDHDTFVKR